MDTIRFDAIADPNCTSYGLTETGLEEGDIPFVNIENLIPDATIDLRGVRYVLSSNKKIRPQHYTNKDDILISRARLPGIAAVVSEENEGLLYGSYIIRFHLNDEEGTEFLPEYVALFINSVFGQAQVHRLKSGSNGYNINSGQLGGLKIRRLDKDAQQGLVEKIRLQRSASARLGSLVRSFQNISEISFIRSCLGKEDRENFERMVGDLDSQLAPVHEFFEKFDSESEELGELQEIRERFQIRPTFYAKLPTDE